MSLKDLTAEKHQLAETTSFMKAVFNGTMPMDVWVDYTFQKSFWYSAIEDSATLAGLLVHMPGIERAALIKSDYFKMTVNDDRIRVQTPTTRAYSQYIALLTDPRKIMAHLYTWHMGDIFGGQMIKKIIDAPHTHLDFENSKELIGTVRLLLSDDMADEANIAFDWAIKILREYDNEFNI